MHNRVSIRTSGCERRCGITWVEVLVVIVILGLLLVLTLPSVRSAKGTAYRAQCQNNLRNVNIAIQAYATAHRSKIPALSGDLVLADPKSVDKPGQVLPAPWSVAIMPYLIVESTRFDQLAQCDKGSPANAEIVDRVARQIVEYYICPSDRRGAHGRLSYVANVGFIPAAEVRRARNSSEISLRNFDMGFNGYGQESLNQEDVEVAQAMGVFRAVEPKVEGAVAPPGRLTLDQISMWDGTSQTVLLTENLNTRLYDPSVDSPGVGGWISSETGDIAFGIRLPMSSGAGGSAWQVPLNNAPGGVGIAGGGKAQALVPGQEPVPVESRINASWKSVRDGDAPRPSSNHPGCVNMAFADGSCKVISDQIDGIVYARLLTPMGGQYGHGLVSDTDF